MPALKASRVCPDCQGDDPDCSCRRPVPDCRPQVGVCWCGFCRLGSPDL